MALSRGQSDPTSTSPYIAKVANATDGNISVFNDTELEDSGVAISDLATTARGLPPSGSTGQHLAKVSGTNYDTEWVTATASAGSNAANLTVLRAITGQSDGQGNAVLGYADAGDGGYGDWVFSTADLSTEVTHDSLSGLYAAPDSDPTGASGAWIRQYSGPINIQWFGASGDGATDDAPAIQAALDSSGSVADPTGSVVFMPPGIFRCASTLRIRRELVLEGSGHGRERPATVLLFDDTVSGITIENVTTTGTNERGDWSLLQNFMVSAAGKTDPTAHGISLYARASLQFITVDSFGGHGIQIRGGIGQGPGGENTNANLWEMYRVRSQRNEYHGLYIDGADSNAGCSTLFDAVTNGGWGILDSCFLGNTHISPHASAGGVYAQVFHLGNRYYLAYNAPLDGGDVEPGTDSAVWVSLGAGVVHAVYPQWVSMGTYREGGAYRSDGDGQTLFLRAYSEGSQPPNVTDAQTTWIGGTHGAGWFSPTRAQLGSIGSQLTVIGDNFRVQPAGAEQFISLNTIDQGDTVALLRSLPGEDVKIRLQSGGTSDTFVITDNGNALTIQPAGGSAIQLFSTKFRVAGDLEADGAINHDGSTAGFYGTAPVTKRSITGGTDTAKVTSLIAALVTLGLATDDTT